MRRFVSLEEAQELLLENARPVESTTVRLWSAAGMVLSEDVWARLSVPHFGRSAVDGYALKADESEKARRDQPVAFKVAGADMVWPGQMLEPGGCVWVGTGDPIPTGADGVVRFEAVVKQDDNILIFHAIHTGENVVPRGEDIRAGDLIANQGSTISAPLAAVLAGQGMNEVPVYRPVKISIVSTGDELVDPSEDLEEGKIYNSVLYGLNARCTELSAEVVAARTVPDDAEAIAAVVDQGLQRSDLVVTTGGVSVGRADLVEASLQMAGAGLLFHGLSMKPGSPTLAAARDGKLVIGLSGNPAAALVSFELLAVPVIKKLMGLSRLLPTRIHGIMKEPFVKPSKQRRILRARLVREDGRDVVRLTGAQSNSVLTSMVGCNLLVDIPAGSGPVSAGQVVAGWLIGSEMA